MNDLETALPGDTFTNLAASGEVLELNAPDGSTNDITSHQSQFLSAIASSNIFIFMLGTNDSKLENQANATKVFVEDYKAFLDEIYEGGNNPLHPLIYICTPPPVFKTDAGSDAIDANYADSTGADAGAGITSMVLSLQGYDGAQVINVNGTQMSAFFASPTTNYVNNDSDGIHPSLAGQQLIANEIQSVVVPEPGTLGLLAAVGLFLLFAARPRARFHTAV